MDELVNQAAKNRFMFGGQGRVPLVARMPIGIWDASAAQHSQSLEAWFAHLPGLVVVCPATPQDNYALLRAALRLRRSGGLHGAQGRCGALRGRGRRRRRPSPLGQARVGARRATTLTLVSWSPAGAGLRRRLRARWRREGIEVDLIDLRTLWPWDREAVLASCGAHRPPAGRRTRRCRSAASAPRSPPRAAEATGCRVARLGAPRIPVGYAPVLEAQSRVGAGQIASAARKLLG